MKEIRVYCPYCKGEAELVNARIEGKINVNRMIWLCRLCDAYCGVHKNSIHNKPLGTLANKELRNKRQLVHRLFDRLWRKEGWERGKAYGILSALVGVHKRNTHIALFTMEQCERAILELNKMFNGVKWNFEKPKSKT